MEKAEELSDNVDQRLVNTILGTVIVIILVIMLVNIILITMAGIMLTRSEISRGSRYSPES